MNINGILLFAVPISSASLPISFSISDVILTLVYSVISFSFLVSYYVMFGIIPYYDITYYVILVSYYVMLVSYYVSIITYYVVLLYHIMLSFLTSYYVSIITYYVITNIIIYFDLSIA